MIFRGADFLNAIVSAEMLVLLVAYGWYTYVVVLHNRNASAPDAEHLDDLPAELSAPGLVSSPKPTTPSSLLRKQASMIRYLEDKIRSLSHELVRAKQQNTDGISSTHSSPRFGDSDHAIASKDQEIRALRVERDRIKRETKKVQEQQDELARLNDKLRQDLADSMAQVDMLKDTISKQAQEISRLLLLLEVQKEANSLSRQTIEQYERKGFA